MERNIDRNLRMAKREARRFVGLSGRRAGGGAFIIVMLMIFGSLCLPEEPAGLLEGPKGWFLLIGIVLVIAALSYISVRGFPSQPRYRRRPRWRT
jgi:hypothetical protein